MSLKVKVRPVHNPRNRLWSDCLIYRLTDRLIQILNLHSSLAVGLLSILLYYTATV